MLQPPLAESDPSVVPGDWLPAQDAPCEARARHLARVSEVAKVFMIASEVSAHPPLHRATRRCRTFVVLEEGAVTVDEVLLPRAVLRRPVHALLRWRPRDYSQEAALEQPAQPFAQPAPPGAVRRFLRTVRGKYLGETIVLCVHGACRTTCSWPLRCCAADAGSICTGAMRSRHLSEASDGSRSATILHVLRVEKPWIQRREAQSTCAGGRASPHLHICILRSLQEVRLAALRPVDGYPHQVQGRRHEQDAEYRVHDDAGGYEAGHPRCHKFCGAWRRADCQGRRQACIIDADAAVRLLGVPNLQSDGAANHGAGMYAASSRVLDCGACAAGMGTCADSVTKVWQYRAATGTGYNAGHSM